MPDVTKLDFTDAWLLLERTQRLLRFGPEAEPQDALLRDVDAFFRRFNADEPEPPPG